ncbi:MAG: 7-cyano-7-deazaguanine synthase QueC [Candidatus Sericytochromatia bacterium]
MSNKAIVLLSGGMDSTTCLAIAKKENDEVATLHLNYGQRTEQRELKAYNQVSDFYNITKRLVVDITHLTKIGGSSLTDYNIEVEDSDLNSTEIPKTYVPFRNANILSIAVSWAEVLEFNRLYIGAVAEDSAGYPDCRPEFYRAFEKVIETGTKPETHIKIHTPLIELNKELIVKKALEIKAPLELTWSCYSSNDKPCMTCDSCVRRVRGFDLIGIKDPIL